MSGKFEPIHLSWADKTYTIQSNKCMRAIALIEDVVTMQELNGYAARGTAPLAKIAMAYASVLEFAGCEATAEEVYEAMFSTADPTVIVNAIQGLLFMMLPPNVAKAAKEKANTGKPRTPEKSKSSDAALTSKKRTNLQSAKVSG